MVINIFQKESYNIIGLMSGTSCDGLDIAYLNVKGSGKTTEFNILHSENVSYETSIKEKLLRFIKTPQHTLKEVSQLNFFLAQRWSEQINNFVKKNDIKHNAVDLIASHGQTIWHQPQNEIFWNRKMRSTLQLGDPSVLANLLNIPVVGDFRLADMALGGQGAPLIPYFDWLFFARLKLNVLAINIGGISNLTFIKKNADIDKVIAFDCGPGNMLIDGAVQTLFNKPYDTDGELASNGQLSDALLKVLIKADTFSRQKPPKSTGRELYSFELLEMLLSFASENKIANNDIIYTLSYYTAYSIFQAVKLFIPDVKIGNIIISGGGARNSFIKRQLGLLFKDIVIKNSKDFGLDEDFKEAIGFAILANETMRGNPSNIPNATGAKHPAVLGKICLV